MRTTNFTLLFFVACIGGCGGAGGGSDPTAAPSATPTVTAAPAPAPAVPRLALTGAVAFMGDSITVLWPTSDCIANSINAGVSGNFTWQMAARFQVDVVSKHPAFVQILGGTNDVAGGVIPATGTDAIYQMAVAAKAAGITPILATIPPQSGVPNPAIVPVWNQQIKDLAQTNGFSIVDYYPLFLNPDGTQNAALFHTDGLHPNPAGIAVMCTALKALFT